MLSYLTWPGHPCHLYGKLAHSTMDVIILKWGVVKCTAGPFLSWECRKRLYLKLPEVLSKVGVIVWYLEGALDNGNTGECKPHWVLSTHIGCTVRHVLHSLVSVYFLIKKKLVGVESMNFFFPVCLQAIFHVCYSNAHLTQCTEHMYNQAILSDLFALCAWVFMPMVGLQDSKIDRHPKVLCAMCFR